MNDARFWMLLTFILYAREVRRTYYVLVLYGLRSIMRDKGEVSSSDDLRVSMWALAGASVWPFIELYMALVRVVRRDDS